MSALPHDQEKIVHRAKNIMKYDLRKIHDFARNLFIEKVIGLSLTVPIEIENEAPN